MIEFGADAYNALSKEPDEENQGEFLKRQWQDIERNSNPKKGVGNSIGGTVFSFTDEWWKANENLPHTWTIHDTTGQWSSAAYYTDYNSEIPNHLNMNEEWWGVVSLSPRKAAGGNNDRIPRKGYHILKDLWTHGS
jgi:hypothetical protein